MTDTISRKHKCLICDKEFTAGNSYIGSHVKRKHGLNLIEYCIQYMEPKEASHEYGRKCKSCGEKLIPKISIDDSTNQFTFFYDGLICIASNKTPSLECKENISKIIFGESYNKKKYEQIGALKEFLSYKYGISIKEASLLKYLTIESIQKNNKNLSPSEIEDTFLEKYKIRKEKPSKTNLEDYIKRYGEIIGAKKYNERNKKIAYANSIEYYVKKYGEKIGSERWERRNNSHKSHLGPKVSKTSLRINDILKQSEISFIPEHPFKDKTFATCVDYYLQDFHVVIEFYGDFWHCNPKRYGKEYFHKLLKITAEERWKYDDNRIKQVKKIGGKSLSVIIIWESSPVSSDEIKKIINDIKGKGLTIII